MVSQSFQSCHLMDFQTFFPTGLCGSLKELWSCLEIPKGEKKLARRKRQRREVGESESVMRIRCIMAVRPHWVKILVKSWLSNSAQMTQWSHSIHLTKFKLNLKPALQLQLRGCSQIISTPQTERGIQSLKATPTVGEEPGTFQRQSQLQSWLGRPIITVSWPWTWPAI